jgi:hypothetical protein
MYARRRSPSIFALRISQLRQVGNSDDSGEALHETVLQKIADNGDNVPKELLD